MKTSYISTNTNQIAFMAMYRPPEDPFVKATGVHVSGDLEMFENSDVTITGNVLPSGRVLATNRNILWSSSNNKVASVKLLGVPDGKTLCYAKVTSYDVIPRIDIICRN